MLFPLKKSLHYADIIVSPLAISEQISYLKTQFFTETISRFFIHNKGGQLDRAPRLCHY